MSLESMLSLVESKYVQTLATLGQAHFTDYPGITGLASLATPHAQQAFEWKFPNDWTLGFFPQILWQLGNLTGNEELLQAAEKWTIGVTPKASDISTHDVGFMVFGSFGSGVLYGGKGSDYTDVILTAAHSLAERFNQKVGMTRSWGSVTDESNFLVIIDNMMNLELLMWASKYSGNTTLAGMALSHAMRTRDLFVRSDGSAQHICDFDQTTGGLLKPCYTPELPSVPNATWARAQAWGLYGFTMMYRYSRDPSFLKTAIAMAEYTMKTVPADGIPYWVYEFPPQAENKDTSAAAITASAMFELARHCLEPKYREYGELILNNMASTFLAVDSPAVFVANVKDCKVAGCSYIVTEAYFVEALRRWFGIF